MRLLPPSTLRSVEVFLNNQDSDFMWHDRPQVEITIHPDKLILGPDEDRTIEGPERTCVAPDLEFHRIDLGADRKTVEFGIGATDPMRGLAGPVGGVVADSHEGVCLGLPKRVELLVLPQRY